jgi:hypothetical protein
MSSPSRPYKYLLAAYVCTAPFTRDWRLVNWLDGIAFWLGLLGDIYHPVPTNTLIPFLIVYTVFPFVFELGVLGLLFFPRFSLEKGDCLSYARQH